jgi:DnaK suppressor protein
MSINTAYFRELLQDRQAVVMDDVGRHMNELASEREAISLRDVTDTKDASFASAVAGIRQAGLQREAEELEDIRGALARIESGVYGQCIVCKAPVPEERLEAWPTAKRCRPCQQEYEQGKARKA